LTQFEALSEAEKRALLGQLQTADSSSSRGATQPQGLGTAASFDTSNVGAVLGNQTGKGLTFNLNFFLNGNQQ